MRNWRGPRSIIGSWYALLGIFVIAEQDLKITFVIFLVAVTSFCLGVAYFLSYFIETLADRLSKPSIGRLVTGMSIGLAIVANVTIDRPIATAFLLVVPLCAWAWFRSDSDDDWI